MSKPKEIFKGYMVESGKGFRLKKHDPNCTKGVKNKEEAQEKLGEIIKDIISCQEKLYAENNQALLVVFQAMDTGGKDGVTKDVFGPVNPQGVRVTSFKKPSELEASHDFLWRIHAAVPPCGMIGIFNRSHYEDVLVHKVHRLVSAKVLERRYRQIVDFERYLTENGIYILKFFLNISKEEQKERLESRLEDPNKRWKFQTGDIEERGRWDEYQEAYEAAIQQCASTHAPWYVIPANKKWYRNWVVGEIIRRTLHKMSPQYPKEQEGLDSVVIPD